jgi:hypothetical protein
VNCQDQAEVDKFWKKLTTGAYGVKNPIGILALRAEVSLGKGLEA